MSTRGARWADGRPRTGGPHRAREHQQRAEPSRHGPVQAGTSSRCRLTRCTTRRSAHHSSTCCALHAHGQSLLCAWNRRTALPGLNRPEAQPAGQLLGPPAVQHRLEHPLRRMQHRRSTHQMQTRSPRPSRCEDVPSLVELGWRSGLNSMRRLRQFRCSRPFRGGRAGGGLQRAGASACSP